MEFGKKIRVNGKRLMTKTKSGLKCFTYVENRVNNALLVSENTVLLSDSDIYVKYKD